MAESISTEEAVSLAKSGNADAQYALSSLLHERGQYDESLHWLALAAQQNLVPARLTLATLLMDGRRCARDLKQAHELLAPLAPTQTQANLLLAELHGFAALGIGDRLTGLRYLSAAARAGEAGALRQLALLGVCHQRWDLVRPLLDAAARGGDACARSLRTTDEYPSGGEAPAPSIDWAALDEALPQLASEIALPEAETLHDSPLVRKLSRAIHPLVLGMIIHLAAPLVRRSQIVDARTGEARADPMRTSSHVTLAPRQHDHVLEALERSISRVTGLPPLNGEFLQILRYRLGEQFRLHVDYFNESGAGAYRALADGGQRVQTVLIYLNDGYAGGSTAFPKLQIEVKGVRGDLLHFHNVGPDGRGHRESLHAGLPVTAGEKWLLSQWIRSESYPDRLKW